jgi:hypothetical protein
MQAVINVGMMKHAGDLRIPAGVGVINYDGIVRGKSAIIMRASGAESGVAWRPEMRARISRLFQ